MSLTLLDQLPTHEPPLIGRICPRCGGQIVPLHPRDFAICLQCGHDPPQRRPLPYVRNQRGPRGAAKD